MFPGHLRGRGYQRHAALFQLLELYNRYPPFLAHCAAVQRELGPHPDYGTARSAARLVAVRWDLNRIPLVWEMEYQSLRDGLRDMGRRGSAEFEPMGPFTSLQSAQAAPEDPTVEFAGHRWPWHLGRAESLAEVREQIRGDLGLPPRARLPAALLEELRALPARAEALGWRLADTRSTLTQQIQWLFWRLCPQPDLSYSWEAIAEAHDARRPVAASSAR